VDAGGPRPVGGRRLRRAVVTIAGLVMLVTGGSAAATPGTGRDAAADVSGGSAASTGTGPAPRAVSYRPPVPLAVVRRFEPPTSPYGPGHLGVDLAAAQGAPVVAAAGGRVSFAGPVAGRSLVVVVHADGIRTEYEPLRPTVRAGEEVRAGQVVGTVDGAHAGCRRSCLHWGARRGASYLDPLSLLVPLGPVRLLPWDP